MATLLPKELRPKNCARATRKERMYIGYCFPKEYLAKYNREQGAGHEEDFVQIHDVSSQQEKEAVQHGKPYREGKNVERMRAIGRRKLKYVKRRRKIQ
jgi:hypothetical protein